jgi:hypothetical protein
MSYPSKVNKSKEDIVVLGRYPPIMRDMNQAKFGSNALYKLEIK